MKIIVYPINAFFLRPLLEELAGRVSVWGALSPAVQQVALNVDSEFQKLFISKDEGNHKSHPLC